jgi:putative DNA primase/helicase
MSEPADDFTRSEPVDLITEDAAALRFAQIYKNRLSFCHDMGRWLEFDGSIWRVHRTPLAFHFARELCRGLSKWAVNPGQFQKTRFAAGVEQFSRADPIFARTSDHWNPDPWLMGTPTGTVDLRSGRHRTSMPSDNITRAVSVEPSEWPECPLWLEFLRTATADDEDLTRFLQQIAGYALTGVTTEHALFFIYGPGGNGKSVFLNVLNGILGDYAATAAMSTFEEHRGSQIPADLAMLNGARLVSASETDSKHAWSNQRITSMTGGDPITARFMRQDFFTYTPQFKLVIVGNSKPTISVVDDAMKRRFNIIPFLNKPKNPDRQLEEKLRSEWPAILRWMIDGCLDWQKNGLIRPEVVREATEEYFHDQNMFGRWCEECCNVEIGSTRHYEMPTVLFRSWTRFAKAAGEEPGTQKSFSERLSQAGFPKKRKGAGMYYEFISLRTENPDNDVPY